MRSRIALVRLVVLSLVVLAACGGSCEPPEPWLVRRSKPIGLTVETVEAPDRATPLPGETLRVRLINADNDVRVGRTWFIALCVLGADSASVCLEPGLGSVSWKRSLEGSTELIDGMGTRDRPSQGVSDEPVIDLTLAAESRLGSAESVLMLGAICPDGILSRAFGLEVLSADNIEAIARIALGTQDEEAGDGGAPDIDLAALAKIGLPGANPCEAGSRAGKMIFSIIPIARSEEDVNHRPRFASITLDGAAWPPLASPAVREEGCRDQGLVEVRAGATVTIGANVPLDAFEMLEGFDTTDAGMVQRRERIFMRAFVTAGDLTPIARIDDDGFGSIMWSASSPHVPPGGQLVRFWLELEDGRVGVDVAERAVCVVR